MRRSTASAELTWQVEKSTPAAYERVISVVMVQVTERAVVYFVMDAVAGARRTPGQLKTGAHKAASNKSLFLCGPRCSGTCAGRCGVILLRAVAAAVSSSTSLRRLRLGVAAQASGTSHS